MRRWVLTLVLYCLVAWRILACFGPKEFCCSDHLGECDQACTWGQNDGVEAESCAEGADFLRRYVCSVLWQGHGNAEGDEDTSYGGLLWVFGVAMGLWWKRRRRGMLIDLLYEKVLYVVLRICEKKMERGIDRIRWRNDHFLRIYGRVLPLTNGYAQSQGERVETVAGMVL